jgi:citrate lyase subunit beta / citryl-CoA lyase
MRSLLMAPADEGRLAEALASAADAVVVDLAGVGPDGRTAARAAAARFLDGARDRVGRPALGVWISPLDSGETDLDLDAVMAGAPQAILLSGSVGAASVQQLSAKLAVREADFALADGATKIIAVADAACSLFSMGSYRGASARLVGIAWSAQALCADIGAETARDGPASRGPYRLARDLTLLAATSAGVAAIDTVFSDLRDQEGLRAEAVAARRDGFTGKLVLDRAQVSVINDVFP